MNCKPGDLAVVVGPMEEHEQYAIGWFITVTRTFVSSKGLVCWHYAGKELKTPRGNAIDGFSDRSLRPVRGSTQDEVTGSATAPEKSPVTTE